MLDNKKIILSLVTLVFAVILCGAGSAATPGQSTTHKTIGATHNNDVTVVINSISPTTARSAKIFVNNTAKNLAKTSSKSFYVDYYFVSKKTTKNSKVFLGTRYFSSLSPGKTHNMVNGFIVPKNIKLGSYYIAAVTANKHVSYSNGKTIVYPKEIDSGVVNVKKYGAYKWHTYLTNNKSIIIYSSFYNPNIKAKMSQTTEIGYFTASKQKNILYTYITPKLTGKDDYYSITYSVKTPENYYKFVYKPIMIKEGPNH